MLASILKLATPFYSFRHFFAIQAFSPRILVPVPLIILKNQGVYRTPRFLFSTPGTATGATIGLITILGAHPTECR